MEFKKLVPSDYDRWNRHCEKHHWFYHTTHWIDYKLHDSFEDSKDLSMWVGITNGVRTVIPLIQKGDVLYSPGISDEKEIANKVIEIAKENGVSKIESGSAIRGWINNVNFNCIVDPSDYKPTKGHHSAMVQAAKVFDYEICKPNDDFERIYCIIAGKQTRPHEAFVLLNEWIKLGFGMLIRAIWNGETAGYAYVLMYGTHAYYFMSCNVPKFKKMNVGHYMQYVIMNELAKRGIKTYDLGEQVCNSLHKIPETKECGISTFKRGFGGNIQPIVSAEYFIFADDFEFKMQERMTNYIGAEL